MQPLRASLEPTKTQEDVSEAQVLPLGEAECNNQLCGGRGGVIPGQHCGHIGQGRHRGHIRNGYDHDYRGRELRQSRGRKR